ncbi:diaminopimelate epimerase [Propioniciclava coleopterorum]|uniref:Diaminopimelate epimerase n=1 Tax=Propioniciclava coleopterorum TaxID=2714937 RepID=A0A6G7Y913_9ACTN|nr:diaminopimelate epimerase [Propioniciclava coleopterorum]QIK73384.1 diaminopimelate epimerase [Propioniciclava coleopterorum]
MVQFAKGHGTRNDFVLLTDPDDREPLDVEQVRHLTDRRGGIGGDGVLRAVRGGHVPGWDGDPDAWFMDYRNADGSIAEMCGNGVRVFARYLVEEGLVPAGTTRIPIGTRAGLRVADLLPDGRVRVWMGRPEASGEPVRVTLGERSWPAAAVDVGNPHAVVLLDSAAQVAELDLTRAPAWEPASMFPAGVNVEFIAPAGEGRVTMRVHERGVGETESCGTGTVAAATAAATAAGRNEGTWTVTVPGGEVEVELAGGEAWLTGPAAIVARGVLEWPGGPGRPDGGAT